MHQQARVTLENLSNSLSKYAQMRKSQYLVGQFWDEIGCRDNQKGIYGMSCWIILSRRALISNLSISRQVEKLHANCVKKLSSAIMEGEGQKNPMEKFVHELKFVVPKMAYAYHALRLTSESVREAETLKNRIIEAKATDNRSWGGIANAREGDHMITAMVVRSFANEESSSEYINSALGYLTDQISNISNHYERLFVLNTLLSFRRDNPSDRKIYRNSIIRTIKTLHSQVYYNPVQFPNPIIVDYHDAGRTRYFRISSDLVLLESLILISEYNMIFLQQLVGDKIISHLYANLNGNFFSKDTIGHRVGAGYCLYADSILREILKCQKIRKNIFTKTMSWFLSSYHFGIDFSWNLIVLGTSALACIFASFLGYALLLTLSLGVFIKTLTDGGKSLYNIRKSRQ